MCTGAHFDEVLSAKYCIRCSWQLFKKLHLEGLSPHVTKRIYVNVSRWCVKLVQRFCPARCPSLSTDYQPARRANALVLYGVLDLFESWKRQCLFLSWELNWPWKRTMHHHRAPVSDYHQTCSISPPSLFIKTNWYKLKRRA